ncbi:predicted protein [Nematostella vectensis]|uniref:U2 snRNP-associated SURP motif-containing protein n=1 Tax=Nematostella vectensis TaxID=45351 RepID=A7SN56_NEMVE|nr:predicted protein [Nematostella vectensis]|eukprot:XP_001626957.1 predicted protein [Nematostella vectensis]
MWPRTEEEKSRNRNCGFVAYMRRKDGDKAIKHLTGKDIMGFEMKLGWGKAVPLPPHPIYVPPDMEEDNTPPPPSGLPFNAQPDNNTPSSENSENLDPNGFDRETLANAVVKVVIPKERGVLSMIHRVVEFVVREGPMFEAMIMNREINNPKMRFLFDNQSHEHTYYRWRLYSILQGDSPTKWCTEKFRMFEGGSWWKPPPCSQYQPTILPPAAVQPVAPVVEEPPKAPTPSRRHHESSSSSSSRDKKGGLSSRQRDKLEDMLRNLTVDRAKIADAMVWCLEHADCADEISECIAESLSLLETPPQVKIARLFLLSDILHNCSVKIPNVSYFRKCFQARLVQVFTHMNATFKAINARIKAEQLRKQVTRCLSAWMDWAIYQPDFLVNLQNIFLGQQESLATTFKTLMGDSGVDAAIADVDGLPLNLDGVPLQPEVIDGVPLKEAALDGVPLSQEHLDGLPCKTRDPTPPKQEEPVAQQDKSRVTEIDETRRKKLREIELKVAEFAQKLEAKGSKKGESIAVQCDQYRAKLLEAIEPKQKKKKNRSRSSSPSERSRRRRRDRSASRATTRAVRRPRVARHASAGHGHDRLAPREAVGAHDHDPEAARGLRAASESADRDLDRVVRPREKARERDVPGLDPDHHPRKRARRKRNS